MSNPTEVTPQLPLGPTSKPSNLILKLLILVALAFVIGCIFLFLKQYNLFPAPTKPSQISSPVKTTPNVYYPQNYDPSGRDLYYLFNGASGRLYSGVGIYKAEGKIESTYTHAKTNYIVGNFEAWEDISGSTDKYMILSDRSITTVADSPISYPKIRIGFSTQNQNPDYINSFNTQLNVQDLNDVIPQIKDPNNLITEYYLGEIGELKQQQIDEIIKKGDAIALELFVTKDKIDLLDSSGNVIAGNIILRRFDPKKSLLKEAEIKIINE